MHMESGAYAGYFQASHRVCKTGRFGLNAINMAVHNGILTYSPPETVKAQIRVLATALMLNIACFQALRPVNWGLLMLINSK